MLVVTIHDVAPPHLEVVAAMRAALERWGVARATLLVVPNFHGQAPLAECKRTVRWLRERLRAGDEVALHGQYHHQRRALGWGSARLRGALFTAGEGECLSLAEGEAEAMLESGKRLLETLFELPVRGFVAPAWLEPAGFASRLLAAGFEWHETGLKLERLAGACYLSPALGFATRSRARRLTAIAWVRALAPLAELRARYRGVPIRIALHPSDATASDVMRCVQRVIEQLVAAHPATTTTEAFARATAFVSA